MYKNLTMQEKHVITRYSERCLLSKNLGIFSFQRIRENLEYLKAQRIEIYRAA